MKVCKSPLGLQLFHGLANGKMDKRKNMEEITKESTLQPENVSQKPPFWQNPKVPIAVALVVVSLIALGIGLALYFESIVLISPATSLPTLQTTPPTSPAPILEDITEKSAREAPEKSDTEKFLPESGFPHIKVYLKTASGTIKKGETVEEKVIFDSTIDKVEFNLFWGKSLTTKSDLDLVIIRPDGTLIDESAAKTDPEIEFALGPGYEFYRGVTAWQYGEWKVRILGKSVPSEGESYIFEVSASDAMIYSINLDKESYFVGEAIKIEAAIEDSFLDVTEPQYIFGMSLKTEIETPSYNIYNLILYDDGVHSDGEANDGIYANTFSNTSLPGRYKFKLTVSGLNNRHGQPFTRECFFFTEVKPKS